MSYLVPATPRVPGFMFAHKPAHTPHSRVWTVRCQTDEASVLGWRWQAIYLPKRRSLLAQLRIRWQVLLRRWGLSLIHI